MTKYKKIYVFIIMFLVCSLSIGFSAFESNVVVGDIAATVRVQENIRITEFNYYSATGLATASSNNYAEELLISNINLPNADSTITYQVTVTNYGNTEMGIYEFTNLPSNLTYEVSDYTMQDKICDSAANCALGAIKSFYLTIKYAENSYDSLNTNYSLNIGVEFRGFHAVTYKNITDNGFPAYIIDGGTLSINITDTLEYNPTIYVDGIALEPSEYSFVDGLLIYENVSGAVEVNGVYLVSFEKYSGASHSYNFSVGQVFEPRALEFLAKYSDGSSKGVFDVDIKPNRPFELGDTSLEVFYSENGITKSITLDVHIGYGINIYKNSFSNGTCAVEINGTQKKEKTNSFVEPGGIINFIADAVFINNVQVSNFEYVVDSPLSIVLEYAENVGDTTAIYVYTSWDFIAIPPSVQVINKPFDALNGSSVNPMRVMHAIHTYADGTKELVEDYTVLPSEMPSTVGPSSVNISYQREGNTYSTTLPVYVATTNGCFEAGTLITMSNGTKKPIEDITYDDELLAWDFNTGRYAITKPSLIETDDERMHRVLNLEFDDGTVIGVIDHHGFFDKKENDFVFIDKDNVSSYVGHEFIKMSGNGSYKTVKLKNFSIEEKVTRFYTIQTAVYNNCIAEDMFTLTPPPDGYVGWFNYFEIGKNLKYDEFKKRNDIAKYGLYSYDEFSEYVTYEEFMAFNGPYLKVLVGKGYLTKEQILNAVSYYLK